MLEKVIKSYRVQDEYKHFVDQFVLTVSEKLGDEVHSIYICGSIPKGEAVPHQSDADFTIVCNQTLASDQKDFIAQIKADLLVNYPFVTKIDTTVITKLDVDSKPLEWGFWLKIICYCIHGADLGEASPNIIASTELILNLCSDFDESVNRLNRALYHATDQQFIRRTIRGYSKRLLRTLYTLILVDVNVWQDDILTMKNSLITHMQDKNEMIHKLYAFYMNLENDKKEFEVWAGLASRFINNRLSDMKGRAYGSLH